ncbi:MAG: transposase [Planctomycetota bacterium]
MSRIRRMFDSTQKANAVRRHLKDGIPVSELAKELDVQPSQIHQWINTALTQIESVFQKTGKKAKSAQSSEKRQARKIERLEQQLINRNEVIAELMEENVKAKKESGDL